MNNLPVRYAGNLTKWFDGRKTCPDKTGTYLTMDGSHDVWMNHFDAETKHWRYGNSLWNVFDVQGNIIRVNPNEGSVMNMASMRHHVRIWRGLTRSMT